jgi:hypothetical protein
VVYKQLSPDFRPRVNLNSCFTGSPLRNPPGEEKAFPAVPPVGAPIGTYRLESGVKQKHLKPAGRGGITFCYCVYVFFDLSEHKKSAS